jgi:hypothetical protein
MDGVGRSFEDYIKEFSEAAQLAPPDEYTAFEEACEKKDLKAIHKLIHRWFARGNTRIRYRTIFYFYDTFINQSEMKFDQYVQELLKLAQNMPPEERNTFKALCERLDGPGMGLMLHRWYKRGSIADEVWRGIISNFCGTYGGR